MISLTFFKTIFGSISTRTLVRDNTSKWLSDWVSISSRFISIIYLPYLWITEFSWSLSSSLSTLLRTSLIWEATYPPPTRVINSCWRSFNPLWVIIWVKILLRFDIIFALSCSFWSSHFFIKILIISDWVYYWFSDEFCKMWDSNLTTSFLTPREVSSARSTITDRYFFTKDVWKLYTLSSSS